MGVPAGGTFNPWDLDNSRNRPTVRTQINEISMIWMMAADAGAFRAAVRTCESCRVNSGDFLIEPVNI
jgi:hypothetical protein